MFEKPSTELSATSKRLLGIRDFDPISPIEKAELLRSDSRIAALDAIDTTTMPRGPKREMKRNIALELLKRRIFSEEILKNNLLVYIGSGTDIEYPLALGGRKITLVDPILQTEDAVRDLVSRVQRLAVKNLKYNNRHITFDFDFGDGEEQVDVELVALPYDPATTDTGYQVPDATGHVILYASQGQQGAVAVTADMKSRILEGGAILHEADVLKIGKNMGEENISLGKSYS